jgi:hypothetical protein
MSQPARTRKRPLSAHDTREAIFPAYPIQKLGATISVELVVGREVSGRHEDKTPLQPPLEAH